MNTRFTGSTMSAMEGATFGGLERKLTAVSATANALTDIIDTQRSLRLEIAVVVLIVIEVAIGCFQILSGTH